MAAPQQPSTASLQPSSTAPPPTTAPPQPSTTAALQPSTTIDAPGGAGSEDGISMGSPPDEHAAKCGTCGKVGTKGWEATNPPDFFCAECWLQWNPELCPEGSRTWAKRSRSGSTCWDVEGKPKAWGSMTSLHRLHYGWPQLEADRCGCNVGSPAKPFPKVDRTVKLHPGREYSQPPPASSECDFERRKFSARSRVYETSDYNTFSKNGALKLTEVEVYFLSSHMTRSSACEWALVYLGVGPGDRFRYLRDEFFPGLAVIAFDPIDENYKHVRPYALENAQLWNDDGTNFNFQVRCFDVENDVAWIKERIGGKKLLLMSDIRGCAFLEDGVTFNKSYDNDLQWQAIQRLRPVSSLVKFAVPSPLEQFYDYAPGVILKQTFCNYGTRETRLVIDGVPQHNTRYNGWELFEKMMFHHEHLRGLVYESTRRPESTQCLDCCFDCTVLWNTISTYAVQNSMDPYKVLSEVLKYHVLTPSHADNWGKNYESYTWMPPSLSQRWSDVEWSLQRGKLMEAIATLEADGEDDKEDTDWASIADRLLLSMQPSLARRLKRSLLPPASRGALIRILGSLAEPFALVKTEMNGLIYE